MLKIAIGSDHAGHQLKTTLIEALGNKIEFVDLGTNSSDSVDYPDFAHPVAEKVKSGESNFGILICGSGNGIAMTANKHSGIRAAICWYDEIAKLARQHNDANIIVLPARYIHPDKAIDMVEIFISTPFEGGRHEARVEKIPTSGNKTVIDELKKMIAKCDQKDAEYRQREIDRGVPLTEAIASLSGEKLAYEYVIGLIEKNQ